MYEMVDGKKMSSGFLKRKILLNTSFGYGIFFGVVFERHFIGMADKGYDGILLYLLRQIFY